MGTELMVWLGWARVRARIRAVRWGEVQAYSIA